MKKKRIFASLSAVLLSAATLHAFPVFAAGDTTVHLVTNGSLPYFTGAAVDLSDPNNDMYFVLQHTRGDMFLNSFGIGFSAFQGDGLTFPITAGEETDDWKLSYLSLIHIFVMILKFGVFVLVRLFTLIGVIKSADHIVQQMLGL